MTTETQTPPLEAKKARIAELQASLPPTLEQKKARIAELQASMLSPLEQKKARIAELQADAAASLGEKKARIAEIQTEAIPLDERVAARGAPTGESMERAHAALRGGREDSVGIPHSALGGLASGLSLGFVDELQAAVATTAIHLQDLEETGADFWDTYNVEKDAARATLDELREANPKAFAASEFAGTALPIMKAGKLIPGKVIPKTTSGKLAAGGATFGGVSATGHSRGENVREVAEDAILGAAIGTAGGLVGYPALAALKGLKTLAGKTAYANTVRWFREGKPRQAWKHVDNALKEHKANKVAQKGLGKGVKPPTPRREQLDALAKKTAKETGDLILRNPWNTVIGLINPTVIVGQIGAGVLTAGAKRGGIAIAAQVLKPFVKKYGAERIINAGEQVAGMITLGKSTMKKWAPTFETVSKLGGTAGVGNMHAYLLDTEPEYVRDVMRELSFREAPQEVYNAVLFTI